MKRKIAIDQWERKDLFSFFRGFDEPYYGITTDLECTWAYAYAKSEEISFFLYYFHFKFS